MNQNISPAVMNQRREPISSFDYFGTPPWATRSVLNYLQLDKALRVADPCCGRGHMVRPLQETFENVFASDIQDLGYGRVADFLGNDPFQGDTIDWVFLNPPFKLAHQFVLHALKHARHGVAVLVRTNFAEGIKRYNHLYKDKRPTYRLQHVERVVMHKGDPPDPDIPIRVWDKKLERFVMRKPSTATSYEWMVWEKAKANHPTTADWLAEPRKSLTRPGDYIVPDLNRYLSEERI